MVELKRWILVAGIAGLTTAATAQVTGPVPLSWRWQQSTAVVPGMVAADGDTLFAAVGRRVYALDRSTGNQKWRFPVGDGIQGNFNRGAMLAGDLVVAPADNRTIYGLDAKTGTVKWEVTTPGPLAGNPVLAGDSVILPLGDDTLMALKVSDGTEVWAKPIAIPSGIMGQIAAEGGNIFVPTQNYEMLNIETLRGTTRWRVQFAGLNPDVRPVIQDDNIFVISGDFIIGLARQNGGQRVRVNTRVNMAFAPAVTANTITIVTPEGQVRTFSRQGRELHPAVDLSSAPVNAPTVVGGKIVVNTASGAMNMIEPADGSILWSYTLRPAVKPVADSNGRTPPNIMNAATPVSLVGDTLFLTGRDGQILAFDSKTGVDLTSPIVKMVFPTPGFEMSGRTSVGAGEQQPFFLWEIEDLATGVRMDTLKFEVDGRALKHVMTRDGQFAVILNGTDNPGLADGPKTLVVTATDWLGNVGKNEYRIFIDNTLPALKVSTGGGNTGGQGGGPGGPGGGPGGPGGFGGGRP